MMFTKMFAFSAMNHTASGSAMSSMMDTCAGSVAMRTAMFHTALILGAILMASIIISALFSLVSRIFIPAPQTPIPWMTAS